MILSESKTYSTLRNSRLINNLLFLLVCRKRFTDELGG